MKTNSGESCFDHIFGKIRFYFFCSIILFFLSFYLVLFGHLPRIGGTIAICITGFSSYWCGLSFLYQHLVDSEKRMPLAVLLFAVAFVAGGLLFTAPVFAYNFIEAKLPPGLLTVGLFLRAYSYTIGCLTTLGYHKHATTTLADLYAAFLAILGVTNSVSFITFTLDALRRNNPETNCQRGSSNPLPAP
jgi:hypothetical protein